MPIELQHSPLTITTLEQFSTIQSKIQEWAGWQSWMHYKGSASLEEVVDLLQSEHSSLSFKEMLDVLLFEREMYTQTTSIPICVR